jgi:hypothetical protein
MAQFPLNPDKPCKYPFVYVDEETGQSRRRFFSNYKFQKWSDPGYTIHPCYLHTINNFKALLHIFINEEGLDDYDRLCIHFALFDDGVNVPSDSKNSFAFIFSAMRPNGPIYKTKYYIIDTTLPIDPVRGQLREVTINDVAHWKGLFQYYILPKLQDTLYDDPDPSHSGDSPTDTKGISYDLVGLSHVFRETEYQHKYNNIITKWVKFYFSSYRTPDLDPRHVDYPSVYPQRLILQIALVEEIGGEKYEVDISKTPDFIYRKREERVPKDVFDTGNICPPACNGFQP